MTSLMRLYFKKYAFLYYFLIMLQYMYKHITAVGSKLLSHHKWYCILFMCDVITLWNDLYR